MVDRLMGREEILSHIPTYKDRIEELECALKDVLVYAPDYIHGMPKKHYEKIAWRNYNGKA